MVIPESLKGLEYLKESLTNQAQGTTAYENIFDTIDIQIEKARKEDAEYTVVMPTFKITSDIEAAEYLREVIDTVLISILFFTVIVIV